MKNEVTKQTRYRPLWNVKTAGPPWRPVWCRLVTVPADPFTTFTSPTGPFLYEWAKCQPRNTQNGRTILPIANLMADSESGSPVSHSSFLVTICLSRLVSEIFAANEMDNADHNYSWSPHCGGPANNAPSTENSYYCYKDFCLPLTRKWVPMD